MAVGAVAVLLWLTADVAIHVAASGRVYSAEDVAGAASVKTRVREKFGRGLFRAAKEGEKGVTEKYWDVPYVVNEKRAVGEIHEGMGSVELAASRNAIYLSEGESVYEVWSKAKSFRGAYFGHDHVNFVDGVTEDGMRLGVTKTMSACAYNDKDLRLRVFRLHADGTYGTDTVSEKHPNGTWFLGKLTPCA